MPVVGLPEVGPMMRGSSFSRALHNDLNLVVVKGGLESVACVPSSPLPRPSKLATTG